MTYVEEVLRQSKLLMIPGKDTENKKVWGGLLIQPGLECPICQSHRFKSLFAVQNADLVECSACSLVYVPTPAPEVTSVYKASYFHGDTDVHGYGNYENEFQSHYETFQYRLRATEEKLGGRGRVLDVGCALGHFGKVALDRGWDVFITDISEFAVQKSAVKFGLKGFVSSPDKLPVRDGSFDCVTLFDVVEHVSHPVELLQNMHSALQKNGVLHLTTPDQSSWTARLLGKHWYHFKPDEHLIYFTPKTIANALDRAGFEVLEIKPMAAFMKVKDILTRLRRYWVGGANAALKVSQWIGIEEKIIKIYVGELEAWARPKADVRKHTPLPVNTKDTPPLAILCCPSCQNEVVYDNNEILCTNCHSSYGIEAGVIDFSRYGKRQPSHQKRRNIA